MKENIETLTDASKEVGLEVNVEKMKFMLVSRHQNAGQNQEIQRTNRTFEYVSQFRYLGTTVTSPNLIQEEIKKKKKRLNSGMLATIQSRTFCLIVCCRKMLKSEYTRL
jgi:hypothetical protein